MASTPTLVNAVLIDTGPPGPHSAHKTLRIANVEGGSGDYTVTWRPICDLTDDERQRISCSIDFRDEHPEAEDCSADPQCTYHVGTPTCCRTGQCGGPGVYTRYMPTGRELVVTIENIPQFASNISEPACQLIFHWTLVDNVTGDMMDGCCGVVFQWKVITPAPLDVEVIGCSTTVVVDTSNPSGSASTIVEIGEITGGVGPYEVTWDELPRTSTCHGTFTIDPLDETGRRVRIHNYNVPQFSLAPTPCTFPVQWTVRDMGLMNEHGQLIGRVESGQCATEFNYRIVNPPPITATVVGCGQTITTLSGQPGTHGATHSVQVGDITGGSGNYTVVWNTTPSIMTGTCSGVVTATPHAANPRRLDITIAGVPQFFNNTASPCIRAYTALITDTVTGVTTQVQCQTSFEFAPTDAPDLSVDVSGCGATIVADSGSCSTNRSSQAVVSINSITGGTGNYTVVWGPVTTPPCGGTGTWSHTLSGTGRTAVMTATFTANLSAVGTCTLTRPITVTDNVTGVTSTTTCTITATAARTTICPPLTATTSGCGTVINYTNSSTASGTTASASLGVIAGGGSGQYTIAWNTTPTTVTGTCYGTQQASVVTNGTAGRTLLVAMSGIANDVDNTASPCVRTYRYTITDTVTGETLTNTCAAQFRIVQATQDCAITIGSRTCGSTAVSLTSASPTATRTFTIPGITGGFSGAPYSITWTLDSSCAGRASFAANGGTTLTTTTTSATASAAINFSSTTNQTGSCSVSVTATIRSVDPTNPLAVREYCGTATKCTYAITWNTLVPPSGTITCPSNPTLTRTANSATRTYTVSGLSNTTGVSWSLTGCGALTVTPTSGAGNTFAVTYTAPNTGAGTNGTCSAVVVATLTGPGGAVSRTCNTTVAFDTRAPAPVVQSVTNCGQTRNRTTPGTSTFTGLTVNHSVGAGGPYTYEWTRTNQTGQCSGVTFSPLTASTQTITPTASRTADGAGTCTATYQVRVRDGANVWSAPVQCNIALSYNIVTRPPGFDANLGGSCCVTSGGNGTAVHYYVTFGSSGSITEATSAPGYGFVANGGTWAAPTAADPASNYEVRFSGTTPSAGGTGWRNLGTSAAYTWTYTLTGQSGGRFVMGTFELRRVSTGQIISSMPLDRQQLGVNVECV